MKKLKDLSGMFTANGCSGVPELTMHLCCNQHDRDYRTKSKLKADWEFVSCGYRKAKTYKVGSGKIFTYTIATIYYIGVSLFGWWPYYKAQK